MGHLSKLDGINRMLRSANQQPVASLSNDGVNDTALAQQLLGQVLLTVQTQGQYCNTTVSTYHPNAQGYIDLPATTLFVVPTTDYRDSQVCALGPVGQIRLYDLKNKTYSFTESIDLKLTVGHPFEDLPTDMQFWICDQAALLYQHQAVGDSEMTQLLMGIAQRSRGLARANDIRAARRNIRQRLNVQAMTNRRFGYRLGG